MDLQISSHDIRELSTLVQQGFKDGLKDKALVSELSTTSLKLSGQETNEQFCEYLEKAVSIIDRAFFFNSVRSKVSLRIVDKIGSGPYEDKDKDKLEGLVAWYDTRILQFTLPIETLKGKSDGYVFHTVAHEMLHAFFHVFQYKCNPCLETCYSRPELLACCHGVLFLDALAEISRFFNQQTQFPLEPNSQMPLLLNSLVVAMNESPGWTPTAEQIVQWGVSSMSIEECHQSIQMRIKPTETK